MTDIRKTVGRPYNKVVRIHKTYWVSEEEHRFITGYLRKRRKTALMDGTGERNRFAEKEERIRKQQNELQKHERKRNKQIRDYKDLLRMRNDEDDG